MSCPWWMDSAAPATMLATAASRAEGRGSGRVCGGGPLVLHLSGLGGAARTPLQCADESVSYQGCKMAAYERERRGDHGRESAFLHCADRGSPLVDSDCWLLCPGNGHRHLDGASGTGSHTRLTLRAQDGINPRCPLRQRDRPLRADLDARSAAITPIHLDDQHLSLPPPASTLRGTGSPHRTRQGE